VRADEAGTSGDGRTLHGRQIDHVPWFANDGAGSMAAADPLTTGAEFEQKYSQLAGQLDRHPAFSTRPAALWVKSGPRTTRRFGPGRLVTR
jgi:hypothetical protein